MFRYISSKSRIIKHSISTEKYKYLPDWWKFLDGADAVRPGVGRARDWQARGSCLTKMAGREMELQQLLLYTAAALTGTASQENITTTAATATPLTTPTTTSGALPLLRSHHTHFWAILTPRLLSLSLRNYSLNIQYSCL